MTTEEAFAREALRALQRYDNVSTLDSVVRHRMMRVQEDLGAVLGLDCTADEPVGMVDERDLSHNAGTCPIHEWVDKHDYALCPEPVVR